MTITEEKAQVDHVSVIDTESGSAIGKPQGGIATLEQPDPKALRRALRKLDMFFLPAVTLIYFLSFLDRSNIGNAKVAGLQEDLKLTDRQYSIALTVTYVPYIAAELPLTLLIRKIGPVRLMATLMVIWGIVTTMQGFVHNYAGLLVARFFLGAAEGAILPACITYLTSFYRRLDLGVRCAFFFTATSLAGAFSGLLAAAILNMEGVGGKRGWMWIFFLEGAITVVYGVLSFFILPDSPQTVGYFTEEERHAVILALDNDRPASENHEALTAKKVGHALVAPQTLLIACAMFCSGTTLFSMAYFSPSIVGSSLGYTGIKVQLYSVPPYAVSTVLSLICSFCSDRVGMRGPFIIFATVLSLIGYIMFFVSKSTDKHTRYASLFFQVMGAYVGAPLTSTWMANNSAGYYRRITAIVVGFVLTNCGGILSTWLFPKADAPNYRHGTTILLSLCCVFIGFCCAAMLYMGIQNKRRAAKVRNEEREEAGDEATDRSIFFRFIM